MVLAGLANLMVALPSLGIGGFPSPYLSWSLWIAALLLIGNGFLWIGNAPPHTRMGMVVAAAYMTHGLFLLVMIMGTMAPFIHPDALTIGRLMALLLFAVVERKFLPPVTNLLLVSAAAFQILKVVLRIQFQPREITTFLALADTGLIVLMAGATYMLGHSVLARENTWQESLLPDGSMSLEDFNNPEHPWNKDSTAD
jgi:hypothetical protein